MALNDIFECSGSGIARSTLLAILATMTNELKRVDLFLFLCASHARNVRWPLHFLSAGIRSWDVDLNSCNLNHYLQEFLSHHTVSFKGAGKPSSCWCDSLHQNSFTFYGALCPHSKPTSLGSQKPKGENEGRKEGRKEREEQLSDCWTWVCPVHRKQSRSAAGLCLLPICWRSLLGCRVEDNWGKMVL